MEQATIVHRGRGASEREKAALRRVGALMRAEAAELGSGRWVADRLDANGDLAEWGERVLPELSALMAAERDVPESAWVRHRPDRCPLGEEEEACVRRLAVYLRAEAAELGPDSSLARRFDAWGMRLAVECERPDRPLVRV